MAMGENRTDYLAGTKPDVRVVVYAPPGYVLSSAHFWQDVEAGLIPWELKSSPWECQHEAAAPVSPKQAEPKEVLTAALRRRGVRDLARDADVVWALYCDEEPQSAREVANSIGRSPNRVYQIRNKALRILGHPRRRVYMEQLPYPALHLAVFGDLRLLPQQPTP